MSKFFNIFSAIIAIFLSAVFYAEISHAAMQSLNGLGGQNQTFATSTNNFNVKINSTGTVHTIDWVGVLQPSQGGTGASSFATGSILFFQDAKFSENNENLFWDNTNLRLGIGTSTPSTNLEVVGTSRFLGLLEVVNSDFFLRAPDGNTGSLNFEFLSTDSQLAIISYEPEGVFNFNSGQMNVGISAGGVYAGDFLQPEEILSTFRVNSGASTTLRIEGANNHTGCLVMGDSDGVGVTYVTANDGVLSATTTKPNICQ